MIETMTISDPLTTLFRLLSLPLPSSTPLARDTAEENQPLTIPFQLGVVLWKVTPLIASWLSNPANLVTSQILSLSSLVLELGCGISGLLALTLAPRVQKYILTDQDYVLKTIRENIDANTQNSRGRQQTNRKARGKTSASENAASKTGKGNIQTIPLDWELNDPSALPSVIGDVSPDLIVACDCIYNDALIPPFVRTCVELCRLRESSSSSNTDADAKHSRPTMCLIAQQLRSDDVFESWLEEMMRSFEVWRVPDEMLTEGLREGSGFVVHVGILRL
jgi:hypothetical protein